MAIGFVLQITAELSRELVVTIPQQYSDGDRLPSSQEAADRSPPPPLLTPKTSFRGPFDPRTSVRQDVHPMLGPLPISQPRPAPGQKDMQFR